MGFLPQRGLKFWKTPLKIPSLPSQYLTVRDSQGLIFDSAKHKNWKWDIINGLLSARYREEISSIAMVYRGEDNTRVWKYNNKDMYTIKYAHLFAMETLIVNEKYRVSSDWSKLWSLKIPQRVKTLLWRVVKGCLSTKDIFQRKGVRCTNACPFCENHYENKDICFSNAKRLMKSGLRLISGHKLIPWC